MQVLLGRDPSFVIVCVCAPRGRPIPSSFLYKEMEQQSMV
jgi:hypothetical protein